MGNLTRDLIEQRIAVLREGEEATTKRIEALAGEANQLQQSLQVLRTAIEENRHWLASGHFDDEPETPAAEGEGWTLEGLKKPVVVEEIEPVEVEEESSAS